MIVIPAIDIKQGRCVRLLQGRMDAETVFSDRPAAVAQRWAAAGATLIHVVDLDGAVRQSIQNMDAIRAILAAVDTPIQVGGGIRDMAALDALFEMGVRRAVIGTEAIRNPVLVKTACRAYPERIVVGIDARNGKVAIEGWTETTETEAVDLAQSFEESGVAAINFTDIHRDGMGTGPNIEETRRMARALSIPVVASGGVSSLDDIRNLIDIESDGVSGVIVGRALYTGAIDLAQALALAQSHRKA